MVSVFSVKNETSVFSKSEGGRGEVRGSEGQRRHVIAERCLSEVCSWDSKVWGLCGSINHSFTLPSPLFPGSSSQSLYQRQISMVYTAAGLRPGLRPP